MRDQRRQALAKFAFQDVEVPVQELAVEAIAPNPYQPRRYFDPKKMEQLAASVRSKGIREPLLVRPVEGGYQLVAGERRLRAAKMVGLATVPVRVQAISDEEAMQIALIENLQREDLNAWEETEAIAGLVAIALRVPREKVSSLLYAACRDSAHNVIPVVEQLFGELGLMDWRSFAQNRLPILNLPDALSEALRQGLLPYTKAIAISRAPEENQAALLEEAIAQDLSVADIRARVAQMKAPDTPNMGSRLRAIAKRARSLERLPKRDRRRAEKLLEELERIFDPDL